MAYTDVCLTHLQDKQLFLQYHQQSRLFLLFQADEPYPLQFATFFRHEGTVQESGITWTVCYNLQNQIFR